MCTLINKIVCSVRWFYPRGVLVTVEKHVTIYVIKIERCTFRVIKTMKILY
jgi:hypothetical protein